MCPCFVDQLGVVCDAQFVEWVEKDCWDRVGTQGVKFVDGSHQFCLHRCAVYLQLYVCLLEYMRLSHDGHVPGGMSGYLVGVQPLEFLVLELE